MRRHETSASEPLSRIVRAIEHPVRRAIIERLAAGDADVGELAELAWDGFRLMQSSTSNHLRVLRDAGLVEVTVVCTARWASLQRGSLLELAAWVGGVTGST